MKKLTQFEYEQRVAKVQENQYIILGEYINKRSKIKVQCKDCGLIWNPTASILIQKRVGKKCKHHTNLNDDSAKQRIKIASKGQIEMIGKYTGAKDKTRMKCKKCLYIWETEPYIIYSGHGCPKCSGKSPITNEVMNRFISKNNLDYELIGEIKNSKAKVEIRHVGCNRVFRMSPHNFIVSGQRCPYEARHRAAKANSYSFETMNEILKRKTNGRYVLMPKSYINANSNSLCKDTKCGRVFSCHPGQLSRGETGCPFCASSKGEKAIREYLVNKKIKFKEQVKFPDCKNINPLPFDFGIYSNDNLIYLIEFQGIQHYKEVDIFDAKDSLAERQKRDFIKKSWCEKNNIALLEIPYKSQKSSFEKIKEVVITFLDNNMLIPSQA